MKNLWNDFPNFCTHLLINDPNFIAHPPSHRVCVSSSLPLRHRRNLYVEVARWKVWCCLWHISLSKRSEPITHFDFDSWCPSHTSWMLVYWNKFLGYIISSRKLFSVRKRLFLTHVYDAVFHVITICFMDVYVLLYFNCICWVFMFTCLLLYLVRNDNNKDDQSINYMNAISWFA